MPPLPPPLRNVLPYRRPRAGRDYWITDGVLPHPEEVHQRCASRTDWSLGAPYRPETWPGMGAPLALTLPKLAKVEAPHSNLVDALGVRRLPAEAWAQELEIENRFNRLLLYKSDLVHSAAGYFGRTLREKRMTALFFWMAKLTVLVLWGLSLVAAPAVSTRGIRRASRGGPRLSQRAARRGVPGAGWLEETTSPRTRRLGQRSEVRRWGARPRPSNRPQQPARAAAERPRRVYGPGHWNQRSGADVRVTSPQPEPHGQPCPTPLP